MAATWRWRRAEPMTCTELRYRFTTVDALVVDFIAAVDAAGRTP
jgi:hypothetical protein